MSVDRESVIRQGLPVHGVTVSASTNDAAEGSMPTATVIGETRVSPCGSSYGAAMTSSTNQPEDDRPTRAQIAEYRAKYGPPVPPTDISEPEDPDTFRALAAELRGESA